MAVGESRAWLGEGVRTKKRRAAGFPGPADWGWTEEGIPWFWNGNGRVEGSRRETDACVERQRQMEMACYRSCSVPRCRGRLRRAGPLFWRKLVCIAGCSAGASLLARDRILILSR